MNEEANSHFIVHSYVLVVALLTDILSILRNIFLLLSAVYPQTSRKIWDYNGG